MVCIIECLRNYCLFCTVHDIKQHSLLDWQFLCCFFLLTFTKSNSPPPSVDVVIYYYLYAGRRRGTRLIKGGEFRKKEGVLTLYIRGETSNAHVKKNVVKKLLAHPQSTSFPTDSSVLRFVSLFTCIQHHTRRSTSIMLVDENISERVDHANIFKLRNSHVHSCSSFQNKSRK